MQLVDHNSVVVPQVVYSAPQLRCGAVYISGPYGLRCALQALRPEVQKEK